MESGNTFMHQLDDGVGATVDTRMVPLVKFLNRLNVATISSGFDGHYATVTFTGNYKDMSELLFNHIKTMTDHLADVHLEMLYISGRNLIGVIHVPVGSLDDLSTRIGCWMEITGK